jgi:hypothetical protein
MSLFKYYVVFHFIKAKQQAQLDCLDYVTQN